MTGVQVDGLDYVITDRARVFSLPRVVMRSNGRPYTVPGGEIKPTWNGEHWQIEMRDADSNRVIRYLHTMMLEAFVSSRPEGMKGLHRDDDVHHNLIENLYWGTSSENTLDSVRNGTHHHAQKVDCKRGHRLEHPNLGHWSKGRACLACNRTHGVFRERKIRPTPEQFQELSDQKFAEIMGCAAQYA